ncbi:MAG: GNAT family protein [Acidimicrobiia bacterium]
MRRFSHSPTSPAGKVDELGLRVVRLHTQTENARAVAAFRKLGFREAVSVPEGIFKAGAFADNLEMDLLREEWFELHPDREDGLAGRPPL